MKSTILQQLPLYSRVYSYGYNNCVNVWAVYDDNNIVKMDENSAADYFSAPRLKLDRYTRPLSQRFGIGFYWDDKAPDFRFLASDVSEALNRADDFLKIQENEKREKSEKDREELQELPSLYPHLKPNPQNFAEIKANLNAELKKHFPQQKFSLKKDGYDSISISWTDGVAQPIVKEIANKFTNHSTDHTGDYMDYTPSNFNHVFGGLKYVFVNREQSDAIRPLVSAIEKIINGIDSYNAERILFRIWDKTTFTNGAFNFKIESTDVKCGSFEDCYRIAFDV